MTNPDELKIEGLEYARNFLLDVSASLRWIISSQSLQSNTTVAYIHKSLIVSFEKEDLPVLNKFLESLGFKPLSINDIKKKRIDPEEDWYHLTIDDKAVLDRLICAGRVKALNDLLAHRLAAAMCFASDTANDSEPLEEFPLYKPGIEAKSFLQSYTPELRYENPPAVYLKSKEKLEFPNADKMGIEISQRIFQWPSQKIKTCCFKIINREKFLEFFDTYSWFDEGLGYHDQNENIEEDSRPREYWLIVNACKEMGIPVSSYLTTFGPVYGHSDSIYFLFPKELSYKEQPAYFKKLQERLKSCFVLELVKSSRPFSEYTIVGNVVNYGKLVELYNGHNPQEKLKTELRSILQSIEQLKKPLSSPAQIFKELKADVIASKYTELKFLDENFLKNIKRKLGQCDITFGSLSMSHNEYIWFGRIFDDKKAAAEFRKAMEISPPESIETEIVEVTSQIELTTRYYVAFNKINLNELDFLSIKIPEESHTETSTAKNSTPAVTQPAIPSKQATTPVKQAAAQEKEENKKSECTIS